MHDDGQTREELLAEIRRLKAQIAHRETEALIAKIDEPYSAYEAESDRVAILRNFIEDASHDLKTPLTILRTSQYLLTHVVEDEEALRLISKSLVIVGRLEQILADMLTMSTLDGIRNDDLDMSHTDVQQALTQVVAEFTDLARMKNIEIRQAVEEKISSINADAKVLQLALTQLLDNAFRYAEEGGVVDVRVAREGAFVSIAVQDYGKGINAEELPYIFKRFYRGEGHRPSTGSTGLGLSIAQQAVVLHGGRIDVVSEVGKGSTFTIYLPATMVNTR